MIDHPITNLFSYDINHKLINKILKSYLYVIKLTVFHNSRVINVNHMKNLRMLNIGFYCGVNDSGISQLVNLTELYVCNNPEVKNINHMKSLQTLHAGCNCGIDDVGINQLVLLF